MAGTAKRMLAATTLLGLAALFIGIGVRISTADEPKVPDLADLRDAVKAAAKRGDNVDEVAKALDALEKMLAKGWKAEPGKTEPPAELVALRNAVEAAARKGENVEEIRKQLDAVEMNLVGRVLVAPKPVPPPLTDPNVPRPKPIRPGFPREFPVPPAIEFPGIAPGGIDGGALQKAMELRLKALDMLVNNPNDPEALKLAQQANEMMLKALGRAGIDPGLMLPDAGFGRVPERFRLGIRMEKLTPIVIEQLGIEPGRGVAITEVVAGSAAEKAGFKNFDIILEFAGKPVSDVPEDLTRQVTLAKGGEKIDAVVLRKGKKVELKGIELPEVARIAPARPLPVPRLDVKPIPVPVPDGLPELGVKPGVRLGGDLVPALPNARPIPAFPNPRGAFGNGNTMSFSVNNGELTIKARQDGVDYLITGTQNGAERVVKKITITDGEKTIDAEAIDKVPDTYRPTVEKLLNTKRSTVRVKD